MTELRISLAAARVNAGYTQREAAKILQITPETLRRYENGDMTPRWDTVKEIERVYGLSADQIFFGKKFALSEDDAEPCE